MKEKLIDEESRIIYQARLAYMETGEFCQYWNDIKKIEKSWEYKNPSFQRIRDAVEHNQQIILYGSGKNGYFTKETLEMCGVNIDYFCDSNAKTIGEKRYGIMVISPEQLVNQHSDALVVITTSAFKNEVYEKLLDIHFPIENIIVPQHGILVANCGKQYFDVFQPAEKEVFVDAGAYDGKTTLEFMDWAGENYMASYVMEPFEDSKEMIEENLKGISNIHVFYKAAWDKDEELFFGGEARGAMVKDDGMRIQATKIDDIVNDDKVTFIKMDIEGSELKALKGAENTIRNNKPKLAICIYHKPEDIIEIPEYIESLVPEYKFAIRHYTSCMWETVLYAWV